MFRKLERLIADIREGLGQNRLRLPRSLDRRGFLLAAVLVLAIAFPFCVQRPFYINILIFVFLYALLGVGWNIIGGYAGQPALGNALFFGIGAYSSGLLLKWWRISPWLGLLVGMFLAMIAAGAVGYVSFRLKGHYFAIATITLAEVVRQVFNWWTLVGGQNGVILPVMRESLLNFQFHSSRAPYYFIALGFLALALLTNYLLERTQLGYYLKAINADEEAASSLGVNVTKCKVLAYAMTAAMTAAAGTFYAQFVLFFDPASVFFWPISIQAMLVTMLGGLGNLWAPVVGSAILTVAGEITRVYFGGTGRAADLVLYGFLIMALAIWRPKGLAGLAGKLGLQAERRRH